MTSGLLFLWGMILGSFLGMLSWRLPRGESCRGRSKCVGCGRTLGIIDLIPLVSYLLQKGRCRMCKKHISVRYFAIELSTGILFVIFGTII